MMLIHYILTARVNRVAELIRIGRVNRVLRVIMFGHVLPLERGKVRYERQQRRCVPHHLKAAGPKSGNERGAVTLVRKKQNSRLRLREKVRYWGKNAKLRGDSQTVARGYAVRQSAGENQTTTK